MEVLAGTAGDLAGLLVRVVRRGMVPDAPLSAPVGAERAAQLPAAHAAPRADCGGRNRAVRRPSAPAHSRAVAGAGSGGAIRRHEHRAHTSAHYPRARILFFLLRSLSRPAAHAAELDHALLHAGGNRFWLLRPARHQLLDVVLL